MKTVYCITGAAGHLGSTLIRMLAARGETARGLILPDETGLERSTVTYVRGDVRDPESIAPLFARQADERLVVIHCAGIVSIANEATPQMMQVNIEGTQNVIDLCRAHGVDKLVYVSSVHALPEGNPWRVITETTQFSPDWVHGGYAKTKAAATQRVLDAAREGLNASVVHPSGIIGPYDASGNHLVQFIRDYVQGRLPASVRGGYDFVDVRDVADGCLAAAKDGESGECYILSNRHYAVNDILRMLREIGGGRRIPTLPMWLARLGAPLLGWIAKHRGERPLYTRYSLYTLTSNDRFSHDKATRALNFRPRDLYDTLRDTVDWIESGALNSVPALPHLMES